MRIRVCVCGSVYTLAIMISPEDALRRRREREREHRARETPEQREARLYQRRLRDREFQNCYTLPSCRIESKSSQRKNSRLFAGIRCALRYLTEAI